MHQKLKIITVLDLLKIQKNIGLDFLSTQLDITDPFELDSLLFEAFSMGLITGKVDQKNKLLKVLSIKGRDYVNDGKFLEQKLDKWIINLDNSSNYLMKHVESLRKDNKLFGDNFCSKEANIHNIINDCKY
jgi:hypothetical protein